MRNRESAVEHRYVFHIMFAIRIKIIFSVEGKIRIGRIARLSSSKKPELLRKARVRPLLDRFTWSNRVVIQLSVVLVLVEIWLGVINDLP